MIKKITPAFFLALIAVCIATFRHYGMTWDEELHRKYGEYIMSWYLSFFRDQTAIHQDFLIYYGGFFDLLCESINRAVRGDIFETRHLTGAFFGVWTVFQTYKIARYISGELAGMLAAVFLTLHPVFYGHMFANPVDLPFAAMHVTAIYYIIRTYDGLPHPPRAELIKLGLAFGLALSVRAGGLILLSALLFCWLSWVAFQWIRAHWNFAEIRRETTAFVQNCAWVLSIAWAVMLAFWPWMQTNPLLNPFKAFWRSMNWEWGGNVFFEGQWIDANDLPKTYLFKSLMISLPEFFIFTLLTGIVLAMIFLLKRKEWKDTEYGTAVKIGLIIFLTSIAVGMRLFLRPEQYDGIRRFLFLVPQLAVLSGISAAVFFKSGFFRPAKVAAAFLILISMAMTVYDMIRIHPYQTVYFNRLIAGGMPRAAERYETDYWGSSYKEGVEWIVKNYHPQPGKKIKVRAASSLPQLTYYLEKKPEYKESFESVFEYPDIYLSTTRWKLHHWYEGKVVHIVERAGMPLLYVIEVKPGQK